MSVELKNSLPGYYTSLYEVGAVLSSVSKELTRLEEHIGRAFANLSVSTAEDHLELWEKDLSITARGSFDERKKAVLAKIGLMRTQTAETVLGLIKAFAPGVTATIEEKRDSVSITISDEAGVYTDFSQLVRELKRALPYHLTVGIDSGSTLEAVTVPRTDSQCRMNMILEIGDEQ